MSAARRLPGLWTSLALVAAIVAVLLVARGGGGDAHKVSVVVPEAVDLMQGQPVVAGAEKIGAIDSVDPVNGGRAARITMKISKRVWPLPQGTQMEVRWGGTASYTNRYVRLLRGPDGAPPIPDGATLPLKDFSTPVEFDTLLDTLDARVRGDLKGMLDNGGPAFRRARPALRRVLKVSPPALTEANGVLTDLVGDHRTLATLVRSTDDVVDAVQRADPGIGRLLDGTGRTINAIATRASDLKTTLDGLPPALRTTNDTLARASRTLDAAGALSVRLAPGVAELRRIASPLNTVLRTLDEVAPDAAATLVTAKNGTPDINRLLARVTTIAPQLASLGSQATTQIGCLRPYTPELMGLTETWGDFLSPTDGHDRTLRAQVQNYAPVFANDMPYSAGEAKKLFPWIRYAFPNPPGNLAGQPWFQPQCGVTKDALDPSKDHEARENGGSQR